MSAPRELLFVEIGPRAYLVGTPDHPVPLWVSPKAAAVPAIHRAVCHPRQRVTFGAPVHRNWKSRALRYIASECPELAAELRDQIKPLAGGLFYRCDAKPRPIITWLASATDAASDANENMADDGAMLRLSQQPEGR